MGAEEFNSLAIVECESELMSLPPESQPFMALGCVQRRRGSELHFGHVYYWHMPQLIESLCSGL